MGGCGRRFPVVVRFFAKGRGRGQAYPTCQDMIGKVPGLCQGRIDDEEAE